jgi:hypothetical protein
MSQHELPMPRVTLYDRMGYQVGRWPTGAESRAALTRMRADALALLLEWEETGRPAECAAFAEVLERWPVGIPTAGDVNERMRREKVDPAFSVWVESRRAAAPAFRAHQAA